MAENSLNGSESSAIQEIQASLPISDDVLALIVIISLLVLAIIEFRRPYLQPGIKVIKDSYLTNLTLFLFNDITLGRL